MVNYLILLEFFFVLNFNMYLSTHCASFSKLTFFPDKWKVHINDRHEVVLFAH